LFFVDLPSTDGKKTSVRNSAGKAQTQSPASYDLDQDRRGGARAFLGAEIESAVQTALYAAFAREAET
jgi:hypothetical protein